MTIQKDTFEAWEAERARKRVYPEACPDRDYEVDFEKATYMIGEREFKYTPLDCGCHAVIERDEEGVRYSLQPGTEGWFSAVGDTLVGIINGFNKGKRLIKQVEIENSGNIFRPDAAVDPRKGRLILVKSTSEGLSDEVKKEHVSSASLHEGGHIVYYNLRNSHKKYFEKLAKRALALKVTNWFKEGTYLSKKAGILQGAGHPEDSSDELYASAYLVSKMYRNEFNEGFYNNANAKQRKIVEEIFDFIETPRKSLVQKIMEVCRKAA